MKIDEIIKKLKSLKNPENVAGMKRFGINSKDAIRELTSEKIQNRFWLKLF